MTLFEKIIAIYPELTPTQEVNNFDPLKGTILLQNDGDGDYIKSWSHPTLPRPTDEELA